MIRIKLSELLGKHKMTRKELSELIQVRPNTIGDLYNGEIKTIKLDTIDKICKAFNCGIEELIEFTTVEEDLWEKKY